MPTHIRIGQAARQTGLSIDTIRFYQKIGLIKNLQRDESGYRVFSENDLRTLRFVGRAQQLGFSLKEIQGLLILRDGEHACEPFRDLLEKKLNDVRQKISDLNRLESELSSDLQKCNRSLKKSRTRHKGSCPILRQFQE